LHDRIKGSHNNYNPITFICSVCSEWSCICPLRVPIVPLSMTGFVNYKKGCTQLTAASDKVYQLLTHGRWFSPASSNTKTGRHDIAEILLKVALNTKNQIFPRFFYWNLEMCQQC